jgi:hypothetical protein
MTLKIILSTALLFIMSGHLLAQRNYPGANSATDRNNNSGIMASLGASVSYYYGPGDRNFGKFEDDRVNWQLNGMLGLTIARDNSGRRTVIGAFGNYGFSNEKTINHLFADQDYITTAISQSTANNYYQIEGGILFAEIFRISTGVGQQNFDGQTLISSNGISTNEKYLKYNSSTVGLQFNISSISWTINCNFAYGQDFDHTVITPATGLVLRF